MSRPSSIDLPEASDPRIQELVAFWLEGRGEGRLPPVSAIDPSKIVNSLNIVWLCDVEEEPRDFRYRLIGDGLRPVYQRYIGGERLSQIVDPNALERVMSYYNKVVDLPAVFHSTGRVYSESDRPTVGERLILPFGEETADGFQVTRILGATIHNWENDAPIVGVAAAREQLRHFYPVDDQPVIQETIVF